MTNALLPLVALDRAQNAPLRREQLRGQRIENAFNQAQIGLAEQKGNALAAADAQKQAQAQTKAARESLKGFAPDFVSVMSAVDAGIMPLGEAVGSLARAYPDRAQRIMSMTPQAFEEIRGQLPQMAQRLKGQADAPPGFQWTNDGRLAPIPGGPQDPAVKARGQKPVLIGDPTSPTGTRNVMAADAVGQPGPPKSGQSFSVGPDGTVTFTQGVGAGQPGRSAAGAADQQIKVNAEAASAGETSLPLLEEAAVLLDQVDTGITAPVRGFIDQVQADLPGVTRALGGDPEAAERRAEGFERLEAISKELGIQALKFLGGNDTERELMTSIQTNVSNTKTNAANRKIVAMKAVAATIAQERAAFDQQWISANGSIGATNESDKSYTETWMAYQKSRAAQLRPAFERRFKVTDGARPQDNSGPSQADLEFTAQKHGITVDEVKRRLNIAP